MKRSIAIIASTAALALVAFVSTASAKDVTLTGEAKCAKCSLKESDHCQTVIQVEKKGKTVTYYVADNELGKGFHKDICQAAQKVKAEGSVKSVDGKKTLTLTKIEIVK